jgi:hypothetical protein
MFQTRNRYKVTMTIAANVSTLIRCIALMTCVNIVICTRSSEFSPICPSFVESVLIEVFHCEGNLFMDKTRIFKYRMKTLEIISYYKLQIQDLLQN